MMNAPFPGIPPELLAKLAQGAFRPPQAMGVHAPNMPQTPGFNMGDGMAGLGMGLGMGAGLFNSGGSVPGDASTNAPSSVGGQDIGTYRGPDSYVYGVPPNNAQPAGGGVIDFLTGLFKR